MAWRNSIGASDFSGGRFTGSARYDLGPQAHARSLHGLKPAATLHAASRCRGSSGSHRFEHPAGTTTGVTGHREAFRLLLISDQARAPLNKLGTARTLDYNFQDNTRAILGVDEPDVRGLSLVQPCAVIPRDPSFYARQQLNKGVGGATQARHAVPPELVGS